MTKRNEFDWITEDSIKFLERGYLSKGESPIDRVRTIADHAEKLLGIDGFSDKFYDYMGRGWYSLSSPVWANFGKKRGMPVSCFGSYVGDSIESILIGQSEVGQMSKFGGGTSGYFGDIRERGAVVSDNGNAPGAVHFMNLFESVVDNISQGNTRRGRFSPYLPIEHPDIEEFLKIGTEGFPIQDLTHAVTVSDDFMEAMIEGDSKKRAIWAKVIQRRSEIGYPYIMFSDTMNNDAPDVYQDKGKKIVASNLCVAPWTEVDVKLNGGDMRVPIIAVDAFFKLGGYETLEIKSFNTETEVVEYKNITASAKTSPMAKVMKITDEATGKSITCTPDHKIYTTNRGYVMAKNLKKDDELLYDILDDVPSTNDRVFQIEYLEEEIPVYDITVEDNHNFFADDVLVHNCSEIALSSNEEESFVCVLSSMNLLHYDEWKDTDAVETIVMFLDAVVTEFLTKLEEKRDSDDMSDKLSFLFMERAYNFAKNQRALGLGVLGWHSLLQSKMIPFESIDAANLNKEVFELIQKQSHATSMELARLYGEPSLLKGYGRRNVTLNAIAPTVSSAFILGQVSQSIEPIWSNCYVKDLAKLKVTIKNPMLQKLLIEKGKDTKDVWNSIKKFDGSVQHLDFLSDIEKSVFKTFAEISQMSVINQAAIRQQYIDQAQSLNLMISPSMSVKEINKLIITAWESGVKTLYYQHGINQSQQKAREKLQINDLYCSSCEG